MTTEPLKIAEFAAESSGLMLYGHETSGSWRFYSVLSQYRWDEQRWVSQTSKEVSKLQQLLPTNWISFYPVEIHRDFASWFERQYQKVVKAQNLSAASLPHRDEWMRLLLTR